MRISTRFSLCLALMIAGWVVLPAAAQTDISRFPLAKAIPADAFIGIAARHNSERQFLENHWARVAKAFRQSGILEDIWDLISDAMEDEQAEKVEELRERFSELCDKIEWGKLFEKEFVHVGRYTVPFAGSPYEGLIMGRIEKAQAAANYENLKAILDEIAKLIGGNHVAVVETDTNGLKKACLGPPQVPGLGIAVGRWDDVVIIAFGGTNIMEECVGLLRGGSNKERLIESDRFKEAFSKLPPAEDSLFFFDMGSMMVQVKGMMKMAAGAAERKAAARSKKSAAKSKRPAAAEDESGDADADDPAPKKKPKVADEAEDEESGDEDEGSDDEEGGDDAAVALVNQFLDDVSIFKVVAEVEWTEGYRVFTSGVTLLTPNSSASPVYKFLEGGKPISGFEKFVPKDATNFWVSTGVNWTALYDYIYKLVEEGAPGGKRKIKEFERLQKEDWELNIRDDILALFEGGLASVQIGTDWVLMLRVKDEKKAYAQIADLFQRLEDAMGKEGGLMMSPVKVAGAEGFKQVSHPMMMMVGGLSPPVWGCAEGHLILASSGKAVAKVLATARGESPNITKNARWKKEGLAPTDGSSVVSISFTDETKTAEECQEMIGALSMALGMAGAFAQGLPPEAQSLLTKIPAILSKLTPVVGKLDFFVSSASYSTFEDNVGYTRSVQNYAGPRAADEDEEEEDAPPAKPPKAAKTPRTPKPPKAPKPADEDEEE